MRALCILLLMLSSCSLFSGAKTDPEINATLLSSYVQMQLQLRETGAMLEKYRGSLPPGDVAILRRAVADTKTILLPEFDKIVSKPTFSVTSPQMELLEERATSIYRQVEGVIDRNRQLLTPEDEQQIVEVGSKLRALKYEYDLSKKSGELKQETIDKMIKIVTTTAKIAVDVAL